MMTEQPMQQSDKAALNVARAAIAIMQQDLAARNAEIARLREAFDTIRKYAEDDESDICSSAEYYIEIAASALKGPCNVG